MTRRRPDPFARPADHLLERLRIHGLGYRADDRSPHRWRSCCPLCRLPERTLTITERGHGGQVDVRCSTSCSPTGILRRLNADPIEVRLAALEQRADEALELAEAAYRIADQALAIAEQAVRAAPRPRLEVAA